MVLQRSLPTIPLPLPVLTNVLVPFLPLFTYFLVPALALSRFQPSFPISQPFPTLISFHYSYALTHLFHDRFSSF
jgi:hypothetical protein